MKGYKSGLVVQEACLPVGRVRTCLIDKNTQLLIKVRLESLVTSKF